MGQSCVDTRYEDMDLQYPVKALLGNSTKNPLRCSMSSLVIMVLVLRVFRSLMFEVGATGIRRVR
jgi:hypothetical protein